MIFTQCVPDLVTSKNSNDANDLNHIIYECCRLLRNSCAIDQQYQTQLVNYSMNGESVFATINRITTIDCATSRTKKMCWQMLANMCVQNQTAQLEIWRKCVEPLMGKLKCVCGTGNGREYTMILYNLHICETFNMDEVKRILELLLECVGNTGMQHELSTNDFHRLFMEHIITKYRLTVPIYDSIVPHEKRLYLNYYIADHMKTVQHELVSTGLLLFICKEFKKKSDCVLRTSASSALDANHAKEVAALLDIIAQASSDERYSQVLATDSSLFINVGFLLRSIHDLGKCQPIDGQNAENIFAPVQKLEQLAPNSNKNTEIERDISYQLKSTLIRTLGNLAYKHKKNQDLVSAARTERQI